MDLHKIHPNQLFTLCFIVCTRMISWCGRQTPSIPIGKCLHGTNRRDRGDFAMAAEEQKQAGPTKLVIRNIGLILSGALERPILEADALVAVDGLISAIGRYKDLDTE